MFTDVSIRYLMHKFPRLNQLVISRGGSKALLYDETHNEDMGSKVYFLEEPSIENELGTMDQRLDLIPKMPFSRTCQKYGIFILSVVQSRIISALWWKGF
jgi:hypothetical protein